MVKLPTDLDAIEVTHKTSDMIDSIINEMKSVGLIGEDRLRMELWRFVNDHTKLLREYYKVGE